ncbi:hypothetical protein [Streptomyces hoynatensis]|uniref:Uncharacterized protein n=1 Tax=Streptomyces hoynatensis TaxID=1141874 RepID=A0A3A9Z2K0_9ACTN|nr:hypothetical protein [Streptomyces hoynatensis]RKN41597.1 hypothetical protein D7294_13935 [Streptomyces hoynatensis]
MTDDSSQPEPEPAPQPATATARPRKTLTRSVIATAVVAIAAAAFTVGRATAPDQSGGPASADCSDAQASFNDYMDEANQHMTAAARGGPYAAESRERGLTSVSIASNIVQQNQAASLPPSARRPKRSSTRSTAAAG